jgi:hypothetical protein
MRRISGYYERKKSLLPRFCRTCLHLKPDRSHHCSVCNTCVLKMDHHCPYINNCVGFHNHKYFMTMLISGTICSVFITLTMWESLSIVWDDSEYYIGFQVAMGVAYFGNTILSIILVMFLIFHFYIIMNALTTIEFREKMSIRFDKSPYQLSRVENLKAVFGTNPLLWLIPVRQDTGEDGLKFPLARGIKH